MKRSGVWRHASGNYHLNQMEGPRPDLSFFIASHLHPRVGWRLKPVYGLLTHRIDRGFVRVLSKRWRLFYRYVKDPVSLLPVELLSEKTLQREHIKYHSEIDIKTCCLVKYYVNHLSNCECI